MKATDTNTERAPRGPNALLRATAIVRRLGVPGWFARLPQGEAMIEEAISAEQAERRALGLQIDALEKERAKYWQANHGAVIAAIPKRDAALGAFVATTQALANAVAERDVIDGSLSSQAQRLRWQLSQSADAAIDAFLAKLDAFYEKLRSADLIRAETKQMWQRGGAPISVTIANNMRTRERRILATFGAQRAARALKSVFVEDVDAALAEIAATIPGGIEDLETPTEKLEDVA